MTMPFVPNTTTINFSTVFSVHSAHSLVTCGGALCCTESPLGCRVPYRKRFGNGNRPESWWKRFPKIRNVSPELETPAHENKLTPKRAEDLVFVHNNLRLLSRSTEQYLDEKTKMWDVGGDEFGTMEDTGFLELAQLSLDEPELESVFFSQNTNYQEDLFCHDADYVCTANNGAKKSKSDATASTGGSSASAQFGELMEQELRLKREAAERAFEAQAKKDRTLMRLEELRFLATSTKNLDERRTAFWIKKQKKLIKNKMKNDLGDEDDEDEDE
ncbi:hypothetical protein Tco_0465916 [Tanacetum coccineum]